MTSKNIPELRFPGFEGEWQQKNLGSISHKISYGLNAAAIEFDGKNKYIRITDIDEKSNRYIPNPLTSPNGTLDDFYQLSEGDIVFARTGASVGKSYLYNNSDGRLYFAGFLIRFSILEKNSAFFVHQLTLRDNYNKWVQTMSMRSGQPGLNAEEYKSLELFLPTLPEQQKIASFLSSLDQRIQLLTRKKEQLEQYKKGVMQQIFSQQLRFKDEQGKDYPEWEERRLGEIGKFKNGLNKDKNDFGYGYPFVNLMDVFGKSEIRNIDFGLVNAKYSELMQYDLKQGDVLFIRSSVKKEGVGEASVVLEDLKNTLYSGFLIRFRNNVNIFDLHYKKYCFSINKVRNQILSISTTSANTNINQESLNSIMIDIPSIEEQQKIASFLSSVDDKITRVNTQIEQTRKWKQGLLQKMFV